MPDRIQLAIRASGIVRRGARLLVGVSGGADSVSLLLALHDLAPSLALTLEVAHLHHGLRGRAADADAQFVRKLAARLNLRFHEHRARVRDDARRRGVSIEMAAREARLDFFRRVVRKRRLDAVALAHTADDQAETLLLRLCRGAGLRGLGGMPAVAVVNGIRIVRPLLGVPHAVAVAHLRARKQAWREDTSNRDDAHLRNRVRREILPRLARRLNPSVRQALCRAAELLREDERLIEDLLRAAMRRVAAGGALRADALIREAEAVQRRIVLDWLYRKGAPAESVDFDLIRRVLDLAGGREGSRATPVSASLQAVREYDRIRLRTFAAPSTGWRLDVKPARGFRRTRERLGVFPTVAHVSKRRVGISDLKIRVWQPGDRMRPLGMDGSKKLQDIFTDEKVPRAARAGLPVVTCRGEIIWLPGYRIAEGWAVENPRAPSYRLRVAREAPCPATTTGTESRTWPSITRRPDSGMSRAARPDSGRRSGAGKKRSGSGRL